MTPRTKELLDAAHMYIQAGLVPMPACGPGCKVPTCTSRGKVPHIRGWAAKAKAAYTSGDLDAFIPLFAQHPEWSNLCVAVPPNMIVIDCDQKHDGPNTWAQAAAPEDLDTWHQHSGGGGDHWCYTLPAGHETLAGNPLTEAGLPGIDYKAQGGQIVAWPSVHTSGRVYEWDADYLPHASERAVLPDWLMERIERYEAGWRVNTEGVFKPPASGGDFAEAGDHTAGPHKRGRTRSEALALFGRTYPEGTRADALASLLGTLRARGTCAQCALKLFRLYDADLFSPATGERYLTNTVSGFYRRYGDVPKCQHGGQGTFVHAVHQLLAGAPTEPAAKEAVQQKLEIRARSELMSGMLYEERRRYARRQSTDNPVSPDAELYTSALSLTEGGIQLGRLRYSPSGIVQTDPRWLPPKPTLTTLLHRMARAESPTEPEKTPWGKLEEQIEHCGWDMSAECKKDGHRPAFDTRSTCKTNVHGACPTQTGRKLRQVRLPRLEGDASYVEIWLVRLVDATQDHWLYGELAFKHAHSTWQQAISDLRRTKLGTGVLYRDEAYYLDRPASVQYCKLLVREDHLGDVDEIVSYLESRLGAKLAATRRYQSGDMAVLQAYSDSMTFLAGVSPRCTEDLHLFASLMIGIKGQRIHQPYGDMGTQVRDVKKEEVPVCDICGGKLLWTVHAPQAPAEAATQPAAEVARQAVFRR